MLRADDPIKAIFCEALERRTAQARADYLDQACGVDTELRGRVEALLLAHGAAGSFLEQPAATPTITVEPALPVITPGTTIGPYKLLEPIGEGGMGTVFMAEQTHPLRRKVALKIIKSGMDTRQVIARFEVERQALALMDHPNIAKVLDAGTTESGRPYFVMELVRGLPITDYCDQARLSIDDRLDLFVRVCQAVQHAHQKGIIHRDIKPSNVMVTLHDGVPVPKVIDFGVAKATGQSLTDKTLFTAFAQLIGTPLYMSPEQAELSGLDIDTRSDIYSLGVLLYELLTGTTPFDQEAFRKAGFDEVRRIIREQEPLKPSLRLSTLKAEKRSTISASRQTDDRRLNRSLRGELDWIVMKALEKDRRRRYETANGFAVDIQRYRNDEAVQACPPSFWYRLRKQARRNRVPLAMMVLLLSTTIASLLVATKENERRTTAVKARIAAVGVGNMQSRLRQQADDAAELSRQRQARLNVEQGTRLMNEGDLAASLPYFVEALRLDEKNPSKAEDHRMRLATLLAQCPKPARIWFHDQPVHDVAFRRDGKAVAIAQRDGTVTVHDVGTGQPVGPILKHADRVECIAFSPDGSRLITACLDRSARIWDVATGREVVPSMAHPGEVRWVLFSPDGRLVVTVARGRNADDPVQNDFLCQVWDTVTGQPVLDRFLSHFRHRVIFSPDSQSIVLCNPSNTLRILDARTGQPTMPPVKFTREIFGDTFREHSFSPDGRRLAVDVLDRIAWVRDTQTGAEVASSSRAPSTSHHSVLSPDGRWVASSCQDGTARVWNAVTGTLRCDPMRHPAAVQSATFSPDGTLVATACRDHAVRVWNAATGQLIFPPLWHQGRPLEDFELDFSPDSRLLLTASADHTVRLWDLASATLTGRPLPYAAGVRSMEFRPDGRGLVTTGEDGTARVWDAATGDPLGAPMIHPRGIIKAARISPDGRSLLTLEGRSRDTELDARVWDLETHAIRIGPLRHPIEERPVNDWDVTARVAWSADGRQFATMAGPSQYREPVPYSVRVWDAGTGDPVTPFLTYDYPVFALEFSPDGRSLVTGSGALRQLSSRGEARVLDASTGELRFPPIRTLQGCRSAAFSPDGRRLVVGSGALYSAEGEARVFDSATGEPLTEPMIHPAGVLGVAFSANGRLILTNCEDEAVRLWDATAGTQVVTPMRQAGAIGFSLDGRRILTRPSRGGLQLWDVATGLPVTPPLWPELLTGGACFRPDGRRLAAALKAGGALLWNPEPEPRSLEDLTRMAVVLSGTRVEAAGAAIPLFTSEIQEAYVALVDKAPETFRATPEQARGWHRQQLVECESAGAWADAVTHLDNLIGHEPNVDALKLRRGLAHAELGHWQEAARDLDVRKLDLSIGFHVWYRTALVQLAAGNRDAYRAACAGMLRHFGGPDSSGEPAHFTAWTCALAPNAVTDFAPVLEFAERSASQQSEDLMVRQTLGAVLYRAGQFEQAITELDKTEQLSPKPTTSHLYAQLFLAMAHHRLGHDDEARRRLVQALTGIDQAVTDHDRGTEPLPLQRRLTLSLLRDEAEALIGSVPPPEP